MSGISSGKKWDRPKLIQSFVSSATGLLVAADVMSLRVPLYFFGQATDFVGDVFHSVARLVRHGLSDIFDQIETGSITVSDALYLVWTAILVGAGPPTNIRMGTVPKSGQVSSTEIDFEGFESFR